MEAIIDGLDIRDNTKLSYQQMRRQFFKKIIHYQGDDPKFLLDTGFVKIMSALGEFYKDKSSLTIRKHLDWIINICRAMNYKELETDLKEQGYILNGEYVPEARKNGTVDWNDVLKALEDYKKENGENINWFIASLYVYNPPRRTLDYANLETVNSMKKAKENTVNYLVKNKKEYRFVFNYYKNSDDRGQVIVKVRPELRKIIDRNETNLKLLNDINEIKLSLLLNEVFGFGTRELRRSWLTHFHTIRRSIKEIEEMSRMMSHSIGTQQNYRAD